VAHFDELIGALQIEPHDSQGETKERAPDRHRRRHGQIGLLKITE
jgi:hypothetical protein